MITPTEDGKVIDCHGEFRTWGCGCEHCLPRMHPLDRGMRLPRSKLAEWARLSEAIDRTITRRCLPCGTEKARLYPGGWFCDNHAPRRENG